MSGNFVETGDKSPGMTEIWELPSKYIPYDFDVLHIRPFLFPELQLIAKSHATKDIYFTIQAVDSVIDQDVNILTIADFYYILYYLRKESYPQSPLHMPWTCNNEVPVIVNGKKTDKTRKCGLENLSQLTRTSMELIYLDSLPGYDQLPTNIDFPRVSVMRSIDYKDPDDPDRLLMEAIKWVRPGISADGTPMERGLSIDDKMRYVQQQPDNSLFESAVKMNRDLRFGVKEACRVQCQECGAERYYRIAISPATFLP